MAQVMWAVRSDLDGPDSLGRSNARDGVGLDQVRTSPVGLEFGLGFKRVLTEKAKSLTGRFKIQENFEKF